MLRAVEEADLEILYKWRNSPRVADSLAEGLPLSFPRHRAWFEGQAKDASVRYFVISTLEGKPIGAVSMSRIDVRNRNCDWGGFYIGDESFLGKKYATETTILILEYAFDYLNLERMYCHVSEDLRGLIRLYEGCGYTREGVLRRHFYRNGKYCDVVILGILRDEYFNVREKLALRLESLS